LNDLVALVVPLLTTDTQTNMTDNTFKIAAGMVNAGQE